MNTTTGATRFTDAHLAGFALALMATSPVKNGLSPAELVEMRPDFARLACRSAAGRMGDPAALRAALALADHFASLAAGRPAADHASNFLVQAADALRSLFPAQDRPYA